MTEQERKELMQEIAISFKEWAEDLRYRRKRISILDIEEFLIYLADYDEETRKEFNKAFMEGK